MNFESTKRPVVDDRPIDVLLAGYAARTLEPPLMTLVAAHLELAPDSRAYVAALEAAHGIFLAALDPVPLPGRDRKLVNIFASAPHDVGDGVADTPLTETAGAEVVPLPLRRFIGRDLSELPFEEIIAGIEQAVIATGAYGDARVLRCRSGARLRAHGHGGSEVILVLAGSYSDGVDTYRRGEVVLADEARHHQPVVGPDGLLCFMVSQQPVADDGPIGRLIGRVLGG